MLSSLTSVALHPDPLPAIYCGKVDLGIRLQPPLTFVPVESTVVVHCKLVTRTHLIIACVSLVFISCVGMIVCLLSNNKLHVLS
jgi:hypothetical protein